MAQGSSKHPYPAVLAGLSTPVYGIGQRLDEPHLLIHIPNVGLSNALQTELNIDGELSLTLADTEGEECRIEFLDQPLSIEFQSALREFLVRLPLLLHPSSIRVRPDVMQSILANFDYTRWQLSVELRSNPVSMAYEDMAVSNYITMPTATYRINGWKLLWDETLHWKAEYVDNKHWIALSDQNTIMETGK